LCLCRVPIAVENRGFRARRRRRAHGGLRMAVHHDNRAVLQRGTQHCRDTRSTACRRLSCGSETDRSDLGRIIRRHRRHRSHLPDRGVELLRLDTRRGKSAAENAAGGVARGEIIVNTDATIRILPDALKALIRTFADPKVGVASGRDLSVASVSDAALPTAATGESGYVGYEMNIRAL